MRREEEEQRSGGDESLEASYNGWGLVRGNRGRGGEEEKETLGKCSAPENFMFEQLYLKIFIINFSFPLFFVTFLQFQTSLGKSN